MQYTVIIEEGQNGFGAFVTDLPGCVAVGESRAEVVQLIQEAIEFHLEGIRKAGQLPLAKSNQEYSERR